MSSKKKSSSTPDNEARVIPLEGELFRFHVHSYTGTNAYLVDLAAESFQGQCSCPNYAIRIVKARKEGREARCKHIRRAIEVAWPAFGRAFLKEVEARGKAQNASRDPFEQEADE